MRYRIFTGSDRVNRAREFLAAEHGRLQSLSTPEAPYIALRWAVPDEHPDRPEVWVRASLWPDAAPDTGQRLERLEEMALEKGPSWKLE